MSLVDLRRNWPSPETVSTPGEPIAAPESAMDVILVEGFRGHTIIGIHGGELDTPQLVRIDLAAGVPRSLACATDRIEDAIDYGVVRDALRDLLRDHRCRLLEALAETIAQLLLRRFGAHWVRVVVVKPAKFDDVDAVGVAIERRRATASARGEGAGSASVLQLLGAGMIPGSRAS